MSKDEIEAFNFTNHDMDHIAGFHRSTRSNFWMFNSEGQVNFEGARVLFRRKVEGTSINPLEVLENYTIDSGRMYVRITNSNYGSRHTLKKLLDIPPKNVEILVKDDDPMFICVWARWFLQTS